MNKIIISISIIIIIILIILISCQYSSNESYTSDSATEGCTVIPIGTIIPLPFNNSYETCDRWHKCNGQSLQITDYPDLYDVIGTTYNENAEEGTFQLPNLNLQGYMLKGYSIMATKDTVQDDEDDFSRTNIVFEDNKFKGVYVCEGSGYAQDCTEQTDGGESSYQPLQAPEPQTGTIDTDVTASNFKLNINHIPPHKHQYPAYTEEGGSKPGKQDDSSSGLVMDKAAFSREKDNFSKNKTYDGLYSEGLDYNNIEFESDTQIPNDFNSGEKINSKSDPDPYYPPYQGVEYWIRSGPKQN